MSLEHLLELVPPLSRQEFTAYDWITIEGELGFQLPHDYKGIVQTYGPGQFGNFIHVHQPNCANEFLDLTKENEGHLDALRELKDSGLPVRYDLSPPSELFCCGSEDNGDPIFWHRNHSDPDLWQVAVLEARGDQEYYYEGDLSSFLCDALQGRIQVSVFPSDFPSPDDLTFTPLR